ncbi:MAG: hypothetical protein JXA14_12345 [Anaerolineae bacterium]|jgi:hypothetical protein|nr:hypothetical protein [Anaerolineae bacterium]
MSGAARKALFGDLIFNEDGQPAKAVYIGDVPHYAVPDGDFLRHVEAAYVDRQILDQIKERILPMKDAIIEGMIQMIGQEDLFTRPAIESAIENMDRILETDNVDVDELRTALWMTGFRATVDVHGEVVDLEMPGVEAPDWDGDE